MSIHPFDRLARFIHAGCEEDAPRANALRCLLARSHVSDGPVRVSPVEESQLRLRVSPRALRCTTPRASPRPAPGAGGSLARHRAPPRAVASDALPRRREPPRPRARPRRRPRTAPDPGPPRPPPPPRAFPFHFPFPDLSPEARLASLLARVLERGPPVPRGVARRRGRAPHLRAHAIGPSTCCVAASVSGLARRRRRARRRSPRALERAHRGGGGLHPGASRGVLISSVRRPPAAPGSGSVPGGSRLRRACVEPYVDACVVEDGSLEGSERAVRGGACD